jgi:D-alanine transaminase
MEDAMATPSDLCSLNGKLLAVCEARIDPLDRGLLFGDALYEVVKVAGGRLLHLAPHLDRLRDGLEKVNIPEPQGIELSCRALVKASELDTGSVFLQITRGVAPRSHLPPAGVAPTVLILPMSHSYDAPAARPRTAITMQDPRWLHCNLKTTSMLATVTGKLAVRDADVDEVLFLGPAGDVREGGSTNVFVRHNDRLETCPTDGRILPGVTRSLVLQFADELGYPVVERAPRIAERDGWQEAFLCGTLTGVQPLAILDRKGVGLGTVGDWTKKLALALHEHEEKLLRK